MGVFQSQDIPRGQVQASMKSVLDPGPLEAELQADEEEARRKCA